MGCLVIRSTIVLVSLASLALATGCVPSPLGAEAPLIRARFDPDSWLIELDVPNPQRFTAELAVEG